VDSRAVAVATVTWARTPEEDALLRGSLDVLRATGLSVAVADKGSSPAFTAFLAGRPDLRVTVGSGLVAQVQASVRHAAEWQTPFILYAESDKAFFFKERLAGFLARAAAHPEAGVILAARSAASLDTYPPVQRYTEAVINHLCAEQIGPPGDYSYGPFLVSRALLPRIAALDPSLGWGWRHAVFAAAHREGRPVILLADDYPCPPDQRSDERAHRLRQLSENVRGLIA
jgi:hypothetical protein